MTSPVQTPSTAARDLAPLDSFVRRHLGSDDADIAAMLKFLDCDDLEALVSQAIPDAIRSADELQVGPQRGEAELLAELRAISKQNVVQRSFNGRPYTVLSPSTGMMPTGAFATRRWKIGRIAFSTKVAPFGMFGVRK